MQWAIQGKRNRYSHLPTQAAARRKAQTYSTDTPEPWSLIWRALPNEDIARRLPPRHASVCRDSAPDAHALREKQRVDETSQLNLFHKRILLLATKEE
jgi:hypothetical protein